ncbi:MAG: fibronectin type III domain-containing protein, partial [Patulibacter sp.]
MAYPPAAAVDAGGGTATGLEVLRQFPQVLSAMQQTSAPQLEAVTPGGQVGRARRGTVVWSSAPVTVRGEPVQRALQVHGEVASPANPLVDARLSLDAAQPFRVGSGARGFSVTAVATDDGAHELLGDGLLHQETYADTDTLVRAVTSGVETYELLRSAQAPERFRYRVDGATPRAAPGAAGVVELVGGDDQVVGTVTAPIVIDASGAAVPASLAVDGDVVELTVAHRRAGVRYPVLADPLWTADYDFSRADQGVGGLSYDQLPEGEAHYDIAAENSSAGGAVQGITIRPFGGRIYQPGDLARATFTAPPGSRISSVDFRDVYRFDDLDRQASRLALYGDGPPVIDDYASNVARFDSSIVLTDPTASASAAQVWLQTPACDVGEPSCPRFVATSNASRVTVGRMVVTLVDPEAPTTTLGGSVAELGEQWRDGSGSETLDFRASDDGSGVRSWQVLQRKGAVEDVLADETAPCDATHGSDEQTALVCPEVDGADDIDVDLGQLREGRVQLVGQATDFAGNTQDGAGNALTLRLDRSPPVLDLLGGSLVAGPVGRWQQVRGEQEVTLRAHDAYSGVHDAEVVVGWDSGDTAGQIDLCDPPGSVDQPCPTAADGTARFDGDALPDGELTVHATARDEVGHEAAAEPISVFKDNTNPAATASGELAGLDGEWTNDAGRTSVVLQGKDRRSGVARLELYATDAAGRRLIDDVAVCDPASVDARLPDGHCPREVRRELSVDLGDFRSGAVTLEAYATDAAGNRDASPDSWDTYLDYDPPSPVGRITAAQVGTGSVQVSWQPADDGGSGVAGYEYRLTTADGHVTQWSTTPYPGVQIPTELLTDPTDVQARATIEVRAKDAAGNRGAASYSELAHRAGSSVAVQGGLFVRGWAPALASTWALEGTLPLTGVGGVVGKLLKAKYTKASAASLVAGFLAGLAWEHWEEVRARHNSPPSCDLLARAYRAACFAPYG